jgi:hypothetical protein
MKNLVCMFWWEYSFYSVSHENSTPRPGASGAQNAAQRDGGLAFLAALLPRDQRRRCSPPASSARTTRSWSISAAPHETTYRPSYTCAQSAKRSRYAGWPNARRAISCSASATWSCDDQRRCLPHRHEHRRRERAERHLAAAQRVPRNTTAPAKTPCTRRCVPRPLPSRRPPPKRSRHNREGTPHTP